MKFYALKYELLCWAVILFFLLILYINQPNFFKINSYLLFQYCYQPAVISGQRAPCWEKHIKKYLDPSLAEAVMPL